MNAGDTQMRAGHCSWLGAWADDVVLVKIHEGGSGPGGGAYACLSCARPLTRSRLAPEWLRQQVEAMEAREARADVSKAVRP